LKIEKISFLGFLKFGLNFIYDDHFNAFLKLLINYLNNNFTNIHKLIKILIMIKIKNLLKRENNLQINLYYLKIKHLLLKELKILI
jgi:hypothetical protein